MKAVLQRVTRASVKVDGQVLGEIAGGLLILLGVAKGDGEADVRYMLEKIPGLRIFSDEQGMMNRSVTELAGEGGGAVLVVSQFTLLGDTDRGRRPGFDQAAPPDVARTLYEQVVAGLKQRGLAVETGLFGAYMTVSLENDGPVTFILDSRDR
jgi:D-tyrosyl-tRNA(Tyr) deacylase